MSEAEFIQEIKRHPKLFGKVYDEQYDAIFNYCYRRTRDFAVSKDITSETFLKAFLGLPNFKWQGIPLRSWLYKIATNEIQQHYRSKKYRPRLLNELDLPNSSIGKELKTNLLEEETAAAKEMEKHAQFLKIQYALNTLPINYQEVISLKYFEKLKIREIAHILNKPEGTIKSLLSRGIKLLKQKC